MTRKDYSLIADCLNAAMNHYDAYWDDRLDSGLIRKGIMDVASRLAIELSLENRRFDKDKFFDAVLKDVELPNGYMYTT